MKLFKLMEDVSFTSNLPLEEINEIEIKDIAYNSRNCEDGFMFVALVGETVDGHKFVRNAYDNGARIFLLQSEWNLIKMLWVYQKMLLKYLLMILE